MSATQRPTYAPFSVDVAPHRDVVRVCPRGELDLATVDLLRDRLEELTAAGFTRVLLDLRELTFLDSSGLRLVLELERESRAEGWELAVIEGTPEVRRVFEVTGLRTVVPFLDTSGAGDPRWRRAWR